MTVRRLASLIVATFLMAGCHAAHRPPEVETPPSAEPSEPDSLEAAAAQELVETELGSDATDKAERPGDQNEDRRVSLDLRGAEIGDVLRLLGELGGVSVVAGDDVKGSVTLRMTEMSWQEAFTAVAKSLQLVWQRDGDMIRVGTAARMQEEQERALKLQSSSLALAPLRVAYLRINFARATKLAELISGRDAGGAKNAGPGLLSERGSISADPTTNTLIVRDTAEALARVRTAVGELDVAAPQVLIESSIVEASADLSNSLGIQWGYRHGSPPSANALSKGSVSSGQDPPAVPYMVDFPADIAPGAGSALDVVLGSIDGMDALELRLTALEREGKARIVSRPRVVTLNNMPATIKSLTVIRVKLPSTDTVVSTAGGSPSQSAATERIETGVILVVTPQVAADGRVLLDLFAKSSQADFSRAVDGIPTETSREATAHVLVEDGETVVLGGIYINRVDGAETGVPFLRHLPALGWLFKRVDQSDRREDLLVFLTPHIVDRERASLGTRAQVAEAGQPGIQPRHERSDADGVHGNR